VPKAAQTHAEAVEPRPKGSGFDVPVTMRIPSGQPDRTHKVEVMPYATQQVCSIDTVGPCHIDMLWSPPGGQGGQINLKDTERLTAVCSEKPSSWSSPGKYQGETRGVARAIKGSFENAEMIKVT
jgi:hypothetical protein